MPFTIVVTAFFVFTGDGVASLLKFQTVKIGGYLRYFCFGTFGAKTRSQPFIRIAAALQVVAAVFAVFGGMASWQNVVGCIRAAFADRNEVILCQNMPQSGGFATISATITPILQSVQPASVSKGSVQVLFSSFAALFAVALNLFYLFLIFSGPSFIAFPEHFRVFSGVFGALNSKSFVVINIVLLTVVNFILAARWLRVALSVAFLIFVQIVQSILTICGPCFFRVAHSSFLSLFTMALQAKCVNAVRLLSVPFQFCAGFPEFTFPTDAANRKGFVKHLASRYANSHDVCDQGGTSAARSRSYSLDHMGNYTP